MSEKICDRFPTILAAPLYFFGQDVPLASTMPRPLNLLRRIYTTMRKALILTILLGAACNTPEDIDTSLMPTDPDEIEVVAASATTAPTSPAAKPEDNRPMDEILAEETEKRKARVLPAEEVPGQVSIATNNRNYCKKGYSTKKCKNPVPIKLSTADKKKLFDRLAKDRKKKMKYDNRGFPVDQSDHKH